MSQNVRISHPELLLFSGWQAPGQTEEVSGRIQSWCSDEMETPTLISCTAGFDAIRAFNAITIDVHEGHREYFPNTFRIDISNDGQVWEPIIHESDFRAGHADKGAWNFPLLTARYIKFLFLADKTNPEGRYFSAFGEFRVMISGVVSIDVTSELDRLWVKENLIDERPEYGWSSSLKATKKKEEVSLDLGSINRVTEMRMLSKNDQETFFPEMFQISYSEDNISWHHLLEENGFLAEPGTWYCWRFVPTNIRYLKIHVTEGSRTREGKYISQIIEIELYAAPEMIERVEKHAPEPVPYASVLRSGIVRLAMDGETREGVVVQANDRRLRDSTTETRGIVELAADGEDKVGVAIQGNDRRLKYASEDLPGIVRLARDGEIRAGHALQSNDSRLRPATESEVGLVELATDGESRSGVVVQGNDRRLRPATTKNPGIVRLGESGSARPNEVIQGNDHRLREATTEHRGIMRFASSGEEEAEAAVQGNDPRLRPATTESPGIVELAQDGEDKEGRVVQGNDRRLKMAGEDRAGIIELATHGSSMKGYAIQASDPRLSDARPPLAHTHEYAPLEHDFSTHTGHIKITGEFGAPYKTLTEPPLDYAPLTGINEGGGAGIVGQGRQEGVFGSGRAGGVIGYGVDRGPGMVGAGRNGPGGFFLSEKGYSLVVGGELEERGLSSGELGLLVRGRSRFTGSIHLGSEGQEMPAVIACYFKVGNGDVVVTGDVLVASEEEGVLNRSNQYQSTAVAGVVVARAPLVLNHPDLMTPREPAGFADGAPVLPPEMRLVAVAGIVEVRAVAEQDPIRPGDLLVTSHQAGRVEKYGGGEYRPGMIMGRSLSALERGEGSVRALLTCL